MTLSQEPRLPSLFSFSFYALTSHYHVPPHSRSLSFVLSPVTAILVCVLGWSSLTARPLTMATVLVLGFLVSMLTGSVSALPADAAMFQLPKSIASTDLPRSTADRILHVSSTSTIVGGEQPQESIEVVLSLRFIPKHVRRRISRDQNIPKRSSPAHFGRFVPRSSENDTWTSSAASSTDANTLASTNSTGIFASNTNSTSTSRNTDSMGNNDPSDRDPGDLTASDENNDSNSNTIPNPFLNPSIVPTLGPLPILTTLTGLFITDTATVPNPFEFSSTTATTTETTIATGEASTTETATGIQTLPPTTATGEESTAETITGVQTLPPRPQYRHP